MRRQTEQRPHIRRIPFSTVSTGVSISHETVTMHHPDDEILEQAGAMKKSIEKFAELTEKRRIEREVAEFMAKIEEELGPLDLLAESDDEGSQRAAPVVKRTATEIREDRTLDPIKKAALLAPTATAAAAGAGPDMGGLYIPMAMRRSAGSGEIETNSTIKVTNYDTLMASEDMMRDLFENFGRIVRVSFSTIRDRDGFRYPVTFIKYQQRAASEDAIQRLHGKPVRSMILSVERAEERPPRAAATAGGAAGPATARRHVTGYGKELAQSTTKSFASLNSVWS